MSWSGLPGVVTTFGVTVMVTVVGGFLRRAASKFAVTMPPENDVLPPGAVVPDET